MVIGLTNFNAVWVVLFIILKFSIKSYILYNYQLLLPIQFWYNKLNEMSWDNVPVALTTKLSRDELKTASVSFQDRHLQRSWHPDLS